MLTDIDYSLVRQRLAEADGQRSEVFKLRWQATLPDSQIDAILKNVGQYLS